MRLMESTRRWLMAEPTEVCPLPGRPATRSAPAAATDVAAYGPEPATSVGREPAHPVRAICCSGGGIRSASFSLGGIQGLQGRHGGGPSWYEGTHLVTAVSGGSYLAGAVAMVNHYLTDDERAELPPYAPGSPEDNRLRNHTRYLIEDPRVAAIGVLSIVYGLLLNLLPILAGIYVGAKLLGWTLFQTGILTHTATAWQVNHTGAVALASGVAAGLGLGLFAGQRLHDVYYRPRLALSWLLRAWSLRLLLLAGLIALALLGVPWLLHLLSTSRVHAHLAGASTGTQLVGFLATTAGLVGLVKGTLGRFKGKLQTGSAGKPSMLGGVTSRILRAFAPWAGSAAAAGLLLAAFLIWTTSAAFDGLQAHEYLLSALAVVGAVVWQAFTDINRNSVHPFYKERLSSAFAVQRTNGGTGAEEIPFDIPIRLSEYERDRPTLVVCAAVNTDEEGVVPSGRGCAPFTFSAARSGISSGTLFRGEGDCDYPHRMLPTKQYEELAGPRLMTLPAAMAVSGAAVSPAMGRMTRAPLRLLLGLANVRLGLWLPNPDHDGLRPAPPPGKGSFWAKVRWQWRQPGIRSLLREILGRTSLRSRWVYVTDGGHYENLGLVEALRRGATEIIVFDASGDPPESWATFGQAVETARADLGVEIDLDPTGMRPAAGSDRAPTLVVEGRCTYPNGVQARLWLCKLALPEKAPASWDVLAYADGHSSFPHDSTAQQLYGDQEFEAYRRLGELAAQMALRLMDTSDPTAPATGRPGVPAGQPEIPSPDLGTGAHPVPEETVLTATPAGGNGQPDPPPDGAHR